jgi:hypothetical protein
VQRTRSPTARSVVEQHPADLEGDEGVDAVILDLLVGEAARIAGAGPHPARLLEIFFSILTFLIIILEMNPVKRFFKI